MQKLLVIVALALGLIIAYVDSRPTWDDAGITAGAHRIRAVVGGKAVHRDSHYDVV